MRSKSYATAQEPELVFRAFQFTKLLEINLQLEEECRTTTCHHP
ncbi:hypothetical protein Pan189_04000 [Stratiformator vulcanicus]|uniref:Uncharacterized protein n=1 Tax=Stratiformator vulcanicus TaxID=2527980 RepID=A0A517QWJ7_9PLAN|nr:hypothetical protein Pan189_04000 [Stratiformator vulcanicus]